MSPQTRTRTRAKSRRSVEVIAGDDAGRMAELAQSIRTGLTAKEKSLPTRWLFDAEGVSLLRQIREQPEYYQVRAECELLEDRAYALSLYFPHAAPTFVELGVVNAERTSRLISPLLGEFGKLRYVAVGPTREAVEPPCKDLVARHPTLRATAMVGRLADAIRELRGSQSPAVLYWPESGIGGYDRSNIKQVMREIAESLRGADLLVAGIDLRKDPRLVQRAYRDRSGRTKRLQLNALERINDALGGNFDVSNFRDRVSYDETTGKLEACLVSRRSHSVRIAKLGIDVRFAKGEPLRTITATKFSPREIDKTAEGVGLVVHERWYDRNGQVSANLMRLRPTLVTR